MKKNLKNLLAMGAIMATLTGCSTAHYIARTNLGENIGNAVVIEETIDLFDANGNKIGERKKVDKSPEAARLEHAGNQVRGLTQVGVAENELVLPWWYLSTTFVPPGQAWGGNIPSGWYYNKDGKLTPPNPYGD